MNRAFLLVLVLSMSLAACDRQQDDYPFDDYESMRTHLGELMEQRRLHAAAALLEEALPRFPDHLESNVFNLAYVCGQLGNRSRGLNGFKYAFDHGVWFNIYGFQSPYYDSYRDMDAFQEIVARNDSLRLAAQTTAAPGLKVVLPNGYSEDRQYPLFIALHGGSGNMEAFSEVWVSDLLKTEFIVAYVQSSQVVSMTGYSWTEDLEISRGEITDAFLQVAASYSIDRGEIIVGGFSAGGIAALEVVLGNDFPTAGFVTLCPPRPENFSEEVIAQMRDRGVRGTILTTEMDPNVDVQREMASLLENARFPHEFVVTPNVGHWIPDNLNEMIDRAVEHIRGG